MKKILSIALSAVIVTSVMNFSAMANDEKVSSISEDIKATASVDFVSGDSDDIAASNVTALKGAGFVVNNVFTNKENDGYVNKVFYKNEAGRDNVIALKQDNYSGENNYNKNMPYIQINGNEINGKPFMVEVWVKGNENVTQQITFRQNANEETGATRIEKNNSVKTTNWTRLGFSYDPNTKLLSYYKDGKLVNTEKNLTMSVDEIRFITLFQGNSNGTTNTYNDEVYWDDIRVFEIPSYYADIDYRNQTESLSHGYGMSGANPYGSATKKLETGTEGNYMSVNYTEAKGENWLVDDATKANIFADDFVVEMSIKPSANGNLTFCMRVVNPENGNKQEYNLFGIQENLIKCGVKYEQVLAEDASPDNWYHLAAVYHKNENKVDVYLDGVKSKTIDMTDTKGWNIDRFNLWYNEYEVENTDMSATEVGIGYLKIYNGSEIWQNIKHFGIKSESNMLNATAEIDSISGKSGRALLLAGYDAEENLVSVEIKDSDDLSVSSEQKTGVTYKTYLWNSLDDLEPLYELIASPIPSVNE